MTRRTVTGWRGNPVDDVQETGGWAWLRINELLWRRPARTVAKWLIARIERKTP